ncbi:MAG: hypothetical protein M3040_15445 [Bacteroidota bacterium]|nr:hypothetical protein [Bacteroidota bacterium]
MKLNYTFRFLTALFFTSLVSLAEAQDTTLPMMPPPHPVVPKLPINRGPILYNPVFDVIITNNGEILYGLVKEVDEVFIKYQRTDIPDGPIYTIRRSEVYAISYRNQVKEFMRSPAALPMLNNPLPPLIKDTIISIKHIKLFNDANVRIGLGFFRGFTKVKNAGQLSSSGTFPVVSIAYDAIYKNYLRTGVMLSFGSHKFSNQSFSSYDSTQTSSNIKENIFSLMVYGKYSIGDRFSNFQPYVIFGAGINSSHITTEDEVNFYNNGNKSLLVSSGGSSVGIGFMGRLGTDYFFNDMVGAFADVGFGSSIIQAGVVIKIQ